MPVIPLYGRIGLLIVGVAATVAGLLLGGWAGIAAFGVAVLGFTAAINWLNPLTSALATVLAGVPMALGFMTALELAGASGEGQRVAGVTTVALFIVAGFIAGALAGYTVKTIPPSRLLVAIVGAVITLGLMFGSMMQLSTESTIWTPGPLPMDSPAAPNTIT